MKALTLALLVAAACGLTDRRGAVWRLSQKDGRSAPTVALLQGLARLRAKNATGNASQGVAPPMARDPAYCKCATTSAVAVDACGRVWPASVTSVFCRTTAVHVTVTPPPVLTFAYHPHLRTYPSVHHHTSLSLPLRSSLPRLPPKAWSSCDFAGCDKDDNVIFHCKCTNADGEFADGQEYTDAAGTKQHKPTVDVCVADPKLDEDTGGRSYFPLLRENIGKGQDILFRKQYMIHYTGAHGEPGFHPFAQMEAGWGEFISKRPAVYCQGLSSNFRGLEYARGVIVTAGPDAIAETINIFNEALKEDNRPIFVEGTDDASAAGGAGNDAAAATTGATAAAADTTAAATDTTAAATDTTAAATDTTAAATDTTAAATDTTAATADTTAATTDATVATTDATTAATDTTAATSPAANDSDEDDFEDGDDALATTR